MARTATPKAERSKLVSDKDGGARTLAVRLTGEDYAGWETLARHWDAVRRETMAAAGYAEPAPGPDAPAPIAEYVRWLGRSQLRAQGLAPTTSTKATTKATKGPAKGKATPPAAAPATVDAADVHARLKRALAAGHAQADVKRAAPVKLDGGQLSRFTTKGSGMAQDKLDALAAALATLGF